MAGGKACRCKIEKGDAGYVMVSAPLIDGDRRRDESPEKRTLVQRPDTRRLCQHHERREQGSLKKAESKRGSVLSMLCTLLPVFLLIRRWLFSQIMNPDSTRTTKIGLKS